MLTIYRYKDLIDTELKTENDAWFDAIFLEDYYFTDATVRSLMLSIDKAVPYGTRNMTTPYGLCASMSFLSTGCKTAINIYAFPDYCFDALGCGNNARVEMLKLQRGRVYMSELPCSDDNFPMNAELVTDSGRLRCGSYEELKDLWQKTYRRKRV